MITTDQVRRLVQAMPVSRTMGLEVLRTDDGSAHVALTVAEAMTNMMGALDAGGLVTLMDTAVLAAILSTCPDTTPPLNVVPVRAAAVVDFLAPADGRLIGSCSFSEATRTALTEFWRGQTHRIKLETFSVVNNATGDEVCRGSVQWRLRRDLSRPPTPAPELHLVQT